MTMINMIPMTPRVSGGSGRLAAALVVAAFLALLLVGQAHASLQFDQVGVRLTNTPGQKVDASGQPVFRDVFDPSTGGTVHAAVFDELGAFTRQAGSHPDFTVKFSLPVDPGQVVDGNPSPGPAEAVHSVDVDLPLGMIGNPNAVTECDYRDFATPGAGEAQCPLSSQVGVADIGFAAGSGATAAHAQAGVYNLAHGPDVPARFGINYIGTIAVIDGRVRPGDYGISAASVSISQALTVQGIKVTLWGVPADESHDQLRAAFRTSTPRRSI